MPSPPKWFHIDSDLELENQINDRLYFQKFLGLSISKPSPNHSTIYSFRERLSQIAMYLISSEILRQFDSQGLTINEEIATGARLVKSASRPLRNDELKYTETNETPLKVNWIKGKSLKFCRELQSD